MATGDNVLTGISVARKCKIMTQNEYFIADLNEQKYTITWQKIVKPTEEIMVEESDIKTTTDLDYADADEYESLMEKESSRKTRSSRQSVNILDEDNIEMSIKTAMNLDDFASE